jgi:uncharacterized protein
VDDTEADAIIARYAADILASDGMRREEGYVQHGTTSVFDHSLAVTRASLHLASALAAAGVSVDTRVLVRGALLHDYFDYDWHLPRTARPHHAFLHPSYAAENARTDFGVSGRCEECIRRHMFPLVPIPPCHVEAWIVCLADKAVAGRETAEGIMLKVNALMSQGTDDIR